MATLGLGIIGSLWDQFDVISFAFVEVSVVDWLLVVCYDMYVRYTVSHLRIFVSLFLVSNCMHLGYFAYN